MNNWNVVDDTAKALPEQVKKRARAVFSIVGRQAVSGHMVNSSLNSSGRSSTRSTRNTGTKLRIQTGRLSRSLTDGRGRDSVRKVAIAGTLVSLTLGTRVPYAAIHEEGGLVRVRPHTRVITQAFGRPIKPTQVKVRGYGYVMPARPYLGPGTRDSVPKIMQQFRLGTRDAMKVAVSRRRSA